MTTHSWHHKSRIADHNLRAAGVTAVQLFSLPLHFQSLNVNPKLLQWNEPASTASHSSPFWIFKFSGEKNFVLALYIFFRSALNINYHHISHSQGSTGGLVGQICFGAPEIMLNCDIWSVFDSSVLFLLIVFFLILFCLGYGVLFGAFWLVF